MDRHFNFVFEGSSKLKLVKSDVLPKIGEHVLLQDSDDSSRPYDMYIVTDVTHKYWSSDNDILLSEMYPDVHIRKI